MENLKQVLGARYENCFKNNQPEDFCNFGLGFMLKSEREELIKIGAIIHLPKENIDVIACDAWCVNTYNNNGATCVYEGSKLNCEAEASRIKRERPSIEVKIRNYPKSYIAYYAAKSAQSKALSEEQNSLEQIEDIPF